MGKCVLKYLDWEVPQLKLNPNNACLSNIISLGTDYAFRRKTSNTIWSS